MDDLLTTITLTDDPEVQAKLKRKAEEYNERYSCTPPEADPHGFYKSFLLTTLLEEGVVDVMDCRARFLSCDWHSEHWFVDAVQIIRFYNADMAHLVNGGTGLK